MGKLFLEEDVVFAQNEDDIEKYIWKPLAQVIGEWRMIANSPEKKLRRQALNRYPLLMAEISRYQTSLENALEHQHNEDFREYVAECLRQIGEQKVTAAHMRSKLVQYEIKVVSVRMD